MPDDEDFAQPITLYGHGTYFAEHEADAAVYPETRDAVIARAQLVCPASAIINVEGSLEDQPEAVRLLALRFIKDVQIVVLPDSLGERMDEDLLADLLHIAGG